jgi:hypothetical protein
MQVATLDEPRHTVREKYAEYLRAVKERHTAEYVALKNAYRELLRGRQVIDLIESMRQAGVDELGRPRLAIIRADARLCWFSTARVRGSRSWNRLPTFRMDQNSEPPKSRSVTLPNGTFNGLSERTLRAVVPTIPPSLLPAGDLSRYHILWEAEWETVPVDPMLLRHLGKNLYVVLATWDLTPLERAVLRDSVA